MNGEFVVAVHALVYLNHKKCVLSSEELAKNVCTNPARIRKVMAKLKKAGFVVTKEGLDGGYRFIGNPSEVSLKRIGEALGTVYVNVGWHSGDQDMECLVASGMAGIMDDICADLDSRCKEQLEHITVDTIDRMIFKNS